MPSEKILQQKKDAVAHLVEEFTAAVAGVIVDYKGISVENDTKLRRELREANVEYAVIKNSLLRRACEQIGFSDLGPSLIGATAIAYSKDDAIAPAKIISKYEKELKDHFTVKAGFIDGRVASVNDVKALADLPSKEELIAKMLGSLNAPATGLVTVLTGNVRGLAIALSEIAKQKATA